MGKEIKGNLMNIKMLKAVCAGLIFTLSGFANAGIIDHGGHTEVNGIDWLDWTSTQGMTQSQALAANDGWRAATLDEFRIMLNDVFAKTVLWHSDGTGHAGTEHIPLVMLFRQMFGGTYPNDNWASYALIQGAGVVGVNQHLLFDGYLPDQYGNYETKNEIMGIALVRETSLPTDVPAPSSLAIFALGMMGLASRRFKKQS